MGLSVQECLIYMMVVTAASDSELSDSELNRIGVLVDRSSRARAGEVEPDWTRLRAFAITAWRTCGVSCARCWCRGSCRSSAVCARPM